MNVELNSLERDIGARGAASVSSANRNLVRKWLCARGVDSPTARSLTIDQLTACYNDTTDRALKAQMTNGGGETVKPAPVKPFKPVQSETEQPAPDVAEIAGLLAQLFAMQKAAPAPINEEKIIELIGKHTSIDEKQVIALIQKHAPIISVEIRRPDRATVKLDGHHHEAFPALLKMVSAGVHVWLSGPAGSGKTTLAYQVSRALECEFYSTGAVTSDFRLMGFIDAQGKLVRTPFREAYEKGGVFLWDEIDASNPNALTAFNQALSNGHFAFPDGMIERHKDFIAIAAANTYGHGPSAEYVGRTKIDGATLDRFATLYIGYDEKLETALAGEKYAEWSRTVQRARRAVSDNGIKHIVSPRATIYGAQLLAAGVDRDTVLSVAVRKGLDDSSWQKVKNAIGAQKNGN
jgi:cobaltochelatase CobS